MVGGKNAVLLDTARKILMTSQCHYARQGVRCHNFTSDPRRLCHLHLPTAIESRRVYRAERWAEGWLQLQDPARQQSLRLCDVAHLDEFVHDILNSDRVSKPYPNLPRDENGSARIAVA